MEEAVALSRSKTRETEHNPLLEPGGTITWVVTRLKRYRRHCSNDRAPVARLITGYRANDTPEMHNDTDRATKSQRVLAVAVWMARRRETYRITETNSRRISGQRYFKVWEIH